MTTLHAHRLAALVASLAGLVGQGPTTYLNFEAPSHKPIACTSVGSGNFLLVCNAPDNAIEVWSTANPDIPSFVRRVPVGLEPITIAVKPTLVGTARRCYVANWLGDSISVFDLAANGSVTLRGTFRVGDEPTGIAFHPADESLLVTFSAAGAWGWFDGTTLQPMQANSGFLELRNLAGTRAVKDPRAIGFSPATASSPNLPGQLCILNHRGGGQPTGVDFDLWATSSVTTSVAQQQALLPDVGGLGSTNFNMAFAPNGDLYVVGQAARNQDPSLTDFVTDLGEAKMQALVTGSTGFVTSQLVRVRGIGSSSPIVDPPLDLNSSTTYQGTQATRAITQPTDVVVRGSGATGTQLFVTGFNSDAVGVVTVTATGFTITHVDVGSATNRFSTTNYGGVMRGPRGLTLNAGQTRVYCYNRLDQTVSVINATTAPPAVTRTFALQRDPTPAYIKNGRKFLYSSALSGGKNVSCASCHIDAGSDFLAWNLSDGQHVGPSPNPIVGGDPSGWLGENGLQESAAFDDHKGPMQTQSLRGLVNFEVANDTVQDDFFSNKPYHWRGDRATFQDFNGAFIHLMAISNAHSSTEGVPPAEMTKYREFINSVHYPPNPEQPISRVYSGSMTTPNPTGNPDAYNDPAVGNGAAWGLKNFHVHNTDGRACVHCHSLPEGSNNRLTDSFAWVGTDLDRNRLETTALRGLVSKEAELWRFNPTSGFVEPKFVIGTTPVATGDFGLLHTGLSTLVTQVGGTQVVPFGSRSIADFIKGFGVMNVFQMNATVRFMREFDAGVGPIIGRTLTTSPTLPLGADISEMETQATRANAGLVAYGVLNGVQRGYWFDVARASTTPYVEQAQNGLPPIGPFTRANLIAQMTATNDLLVFQSVPLGSERRIALVGTGPTVQLIPTAPSAITLRGCRPSTANVEVPNLTAQWFRLFQVGGLGSNGGLNLGNNKAQIYYQGSLIHQTPGVSPAGFGLGNMRHEPPRRFVVTGNNIQHGAWLRIYLPRSSDWATASTTTPPTTTPNATTHPDPIEVPIHAAVDPSTGQLEWQSAVELEPYHLLALLNGGPHSAQVQQAVLNPTSLDALSPPIIPPVGGGATQDFFEPRRRNWYYVQVVNDLGVPTSASAGSWQRLTLQ